MLEFRVIERGGYIPAVEKNKAFLRADGWNDYSFVTMFYLTVFDEHGENAISGMLKLVLSVKRRSKYLFINR